MLDKAAAFATSGRSDDARSAYKQAEAVSAGDVRASYSLAVLDLRDSRFEDARRRLKSVIRRRPSFFSAQHNLGVAEQALGHWPSAVDAFQAALDADPTAAQTRRNLAIALAVTGRVHDAVENFRRVAKDPAHRADALARLAILSPQSVDAVELADLRDYALDRELPAPARVGPLFALGGVLEAQGQVDAAFHAFASGNALKRQLLEEGPAEHRPSAVARAHQASVEHIRRLFTSEFLAEHRRGGDEKSRPIFIVGMPRSGTSLIEQILSSHPNVQGMGESDALWGAVDGRFPYPPDACRATGHFRDLARLYLARQRARGWNGVSRFTDKTLDSHLHIGLIRLMFPRAVVLHIARDPMDTALACYRQLFATGNETLYDLADIAAEWRRYRAMMTHWRQVAPGAVVDVSYEALTEDPKAIIPRLVADICGLPWSEDCLRFHENTRAVRTASASQVRQPMTRASVDRWRQYETHLTPLIHALRNEARTLADG